jgi:hypothetical protein
VFDRIFNRLRTNDEPKNKNGEADNDDQEKQCNCNALQPVRALTWQDRYAGSAARWPGHGYRLIVAKLEDLDREKRWWDGFKGRKIDALSNVRHSYRLLLEISAVLRNIYFLSGFI